MRGAPLQDPEALRPRTLQVDGEDLEVARDIASTAAISLTEYVHTGHTLLRHLGSVGVTSESAFVIEGTAHHLPRLNDPLRHTQPITMIVRPKVMIESAAMRNAQQIGLGNYISRTMRLLNYLDMHDATTPLLLRNRGNEGYILLPFWYNKRTKQEGVAAQ